MGLVKRNVIWRPNSPQQIAFLEYGGFEAMYGGAAGGGKSAALLASLLRFAHMRDYVGILFRRTHPELEKYVIPRALRLYPLVFPGAVYNKSKHYWTFPSGAVIWFSHLQYDEDVFAHRTAEYQQICFDELTSFTLFQYTYMISRLRKTFDIPIFVRSGTNPGDEGHDWVFDRFAPWLNPEAKKMGLPVAKTGQPLYFKPRSDGGETWVKQGTPGSFGRLFVQSFAKDNPDLARNDPDYIDRMRMMDPVSQAQMIEGDWTAKPVSGTLFKRGWFGDPITQAPLSLRRVRFWDRAASPPTKARPNPDWTRGVLLGIDDDEGYLYILDVVGCQDVPGEVKKLIKSTAETDGKDVSVGLWQDPAAAGKFEIAEYVKFLQGWDVRAILQSKDKVTYARPVSAQAYAKKVRIVRGPWNKPLFDELEGFPDPKKWHDDQVDALSGAYVFLLDGEATVADNWLRAGEHL